MSTITTQQSSGYSASGRSGIRQQSSWPFIAKLCVAGAILATGLLLVLQSNILGVIVGICLIGLIFAHALELQHEALHGLAFRSRRANEIVGICLGLPMLVSFADYQVSHLRHHRDLGTDRNREFFDYGNQYGDANRGDVSRLASLALRFFMFNHYRQFATKLWLAVTGRPVPEETPVSSRRIRRDHLVILGTLVLTAGLSVVVGKPLVLTAWLLPLMLVACPVHALIELPEHYGCQTDTTEVFLNTRTVRTNRLVVWFVNSNNYHVEHHLKPRVPFSELPSLHREVASNSIHVSDGYRRILPDLLGSMWRPKKTAKRPPDVSDAA